MQTAHRNIEERSISSLLLDLGTETRDLIRKEIELARTEISENTANALKAVQSMAAGGALAYAWFLVLLAAAVFGLDEWLQRPWLSALIVGGLVLAVAAALAMAGRQVARTKAITPEKSPRSLRLDKELVQKHV